MRKRSKAQSAQRPTNEEITAFYERHSPGVFRLCMSYLKNTQDSADVMQETFLRWLDCPRSFESEAHEIAWLVTTAGNLCKDMLRRRKRHPQTDIAEFADAGREEDGYTNAELFEAVASLPDKYKNVIFMFYYEDMTVAQISEATGIKQSTVTSLLTRARRSLKEKLGDDDNG